jgi:hypothetical protein
MEGEKTNAYKDLTGKPEQTTLIVRPRDRWKGNVKMDLKETGCDDMDWIHLAQDRNK